MYQILHLPTGTSLYCKHAERPADLTLYTEIEVEERKDNSMSRFFGSLAHAEACIAYSVDEIAFDFGDDYPSQDLLLHHCQIIEVKDV